jgi:hypothetical protein
LRLDPHAQALVDDEAPVPAWYLVQGLERSGDLREVGFVAEALEAPAQVPANARHVQERHGRAPLPDPPKLVFRDDDPGARVAVKTMAAALEQKP